MPSVFAKAPLFGSECTTGPLTTKSTLSAPTRTSSALVDFPLASGFFTASLGVCPDKVDGGRVAVAALDQPRPVLRHHEVQILLLRAFETAAAEHQAVIIGVAARLHQRKRALQRVRARRGVRRIPIHRRLRIGRVEARPHGDELDRAGGVRVRRRRAAIDAHLPALRRLGKAAPKRPTRIPQHESDVSSRVSPFSDSPPVYNMAMPDERGLAPGHRRALKPRSLERR